MPKLKTISFASEEASSFKINTILLKSIFVFTIAFIGCADKDGDKSKSGRVITSQEASPAKEISIEEMSFEQLYGCKKIECYDEYKKRLKEAVAYVDSVYAEGNVDDASQLSAWFYAILKSDGSTINMRNEAPSAESVARRIEKLYPQKGCIEDSVQYVNYFSTIYEVEKNLEPDDEKIKKIFKRYFGYLNKNCKLRHYDEDVLAMEEHFVTGALKRKDITVSKAQNLRNDMRKGEILVDERDGRKYKTVKIGQQIWMAENLNHPVSGSHCYKNNAANCKKYGRLYSWSYAIEACPDGWHLPSVDEFKELIKNVGGESAGKSLKSTTGWARQDGKDCNGTDEYGFSVRAGGGDFFFCEDCHMTKHASFWSSTVTKREPAGPGLRDNEWAARMFIGSDEDCDAIVVQSVASNYGVNEFSVRCVKD